jgi:hypothetical protein
MKSRTALKVIGAAIAALGFVFTMSAEVAAQENPPNNMQVLAEKIKANKKLVVDTNMGLTESEAKVFWPIYDAYQKDLAQLNGRWYKLIKTYAGYYNSNTLTDANAKELTVDAMAIETAELELKKSYLPKLYGALPAVKVARYIQIENKVRAIVKLDLAAEVPLIP